MFIIQFVIPIPKEKADGIDSRVIELFKDAPQNLVRIKDIHMGRFAAVDFDLFCQYFPVFFVESAGPLILRSDTHLEAIYLQALKIMW